MRINCYNFTSSNKYDCVTGEEALKYVIDTKRGNGCTIIIAIKLTSAFEVFFCDSGELVSRKRRFLQLQTTSVLKRTKFSQTDIM